MGRELRLVNDSSDFVLHLADCSFLVGILDVVALEEEHGSEGICALVGFLEGLPRGVVGIL